MSHVIGKIRFLGLLLALCGSMEGFACEDDTASPQHQKPIVQESPFNFSNHEPAVDLDSTMDDDFAIEKKISVGHSGTSANTTQSTLLAINARISSCAQSLDRSYAVSHSAFLRWMIALSRSATPPPV